MNAKASTSRGASVSKLTTRDALQSSFEHHKKSAWQSITKLIEAPSAFLLTSLVIGIALALPAMLFLMIENLSQLADRWDGAPRITVYLNNSVSDDHATAFGNRLKMIDGVSALEYISRDAALNEFKLKSGLGEALTQLEENPLPPVYVLTLDNASPDLAHRVVEKVDALSDVDFVQMDMDWVQKLQQIVLFARRGAFLLGGLLSLGVLLTVANTLRLEILNRREEIVVVKLVGGTDAFVRRPLLYTGVWYGLFGAIIAWILVITSMGYLSSPVVSLISLYGSDFAFVNLGFLTTLKLLLTGVLLGLAGAWLAVSQHIHRINPS